MLKKLKKVKKLKRIRKKSPLLFTKKKVPDSKFERMVGAWLRTLGINIEHQFKLGFKYYDFKVKGENILIEADSDYYHCNPEIFPLGPQDKMQVNNIKNDLYKDKLAASNGYKLIRIWECDFKKRRIATGKKVKELINE